MRVNSQYKVRLFLAYFFMLGLAKQVQIQESKNSSLFGKKNESLSQAALASEIFCREDRPPPFKALAIVSELRLFILYALSSTTLKY